MGSVWEFAFSTAAAMSFFPDYCVLLVRSSYFRSARHPANITFFQQVLPSHPTKLPPTDSPNRPKYRRAFWRARSHFYGDHPELILVRIAVEESSLILPDAL
jgi:hypothetical protein